MVLCFLACRQESKTSPHLNLGGDESESGAVETASSESAASATKVLALHEELKLLDELGFTPKELDRILTRLGLTREQASASAESQNISTEDYLLLLILNEPFAH